MSIVITVIRYDTSQHLTHFHKHQHFTILHFSPTSRFQRRANHLGLLEDRGLTIAPILSHRSYIAPTDRHRLDNTDRHILDNTDRHRLDNTDRHRLDNTDRHRPDNTRQHQTLSGI